MKRMIFLDGLESSLSCSGIQCLCGSGLFVVFDVKRDWEAREKVGKKGAARCSTP